MGRRAKFFPEQIVEIHNLRAAGATVADIAKQYNTTIVTIYKYLKMEIVDGAPVLNQHGQVVESATQG